MYHTIFSGGGKFYSGINSGVPAICSRHGGRAVGENSIIDPPEEVQDISLEQKGDVFENATHKCQQCRNCPEGWHASCRLKVQWKEGSVYRAKMDIDYSSSEHTDMTIWFEARSGSEP